MDGYLFDEENLPGFAIGERFWGGGRSGKEEKRKAVQLIWEFFGVKRGIFCTEYN